MDEFASSAKEKITILHMSLSYYFIYYNYDKLKKEKKSLLTTLIVKNF